MRDGLARLEPLRSDEGREQVREEKRGCRRRKPYHVATS
jgi:hypothetical protein